jgi:GT2 family glycosyltransferase
MDENLNIIFYCVNYINYREVCDFTKKVNELKQNEKCKIVIVNNSDITEFNNLVYNLNQFNNVEIIHSPENLGYINGIYKGYIETNRKYHNTTQYHIMCNTDISFENEFFIENLFKIYTEEDEIVLAPKIVSKLTGANQNPFLINRPTKLLFLKWKISHLNSCFYILNNWLSMLKNKLRKKSEKQSQKIYAPHGSFIIFKNTFFELDCTLQYPKFLYGEEVFIGEQVFRLNKAIKYVNDLKVIHEEHTSTSLLGNEKKRKIKRDVNAYLNDLLNNN